ncbi:MAG: hypothetical protein ABIJ91_01215 [Candidatus Kuenenbacteria bacterium]
MKEVRKVNINQAIKKAKEELRKRDGPIKINAKINKIFFGNCELIRIGDLRKKILELEFEIEMIKISKIEIEKRIEQFTLAN